MRARPAVAFGGLIAFGLISVCEAAQPVYKSVDEAGNITYSAQPPPGADAVKQMELDPGPTEAQQAAAEERVRQQVEAADSAASSGEERQGARAAVKASRAPAPEPDEQTRVDSYPRRTINREAGILSPEAVPLPGGAALIPMPAN